MPSLAYTIDVVTKRLVRDFTTNIQLTPAALTQGNTYDTSLRFVSPTNSSAIPFTDVDYSGYTVEMGLGVLNKPPTGGTFTLADGSAPGTATTALPFNASAAAVYNALNLLAAITSAGGVNVATPANAGAGGPWQVTWNTAGARDLLVANTALLAPLSGAKIERLTVGDVDTAEVQLITLRQSPAAYQDDWDNLATPGAVVTELTKGQASGPARNEVQRIALSPVPYSGTFAVVCLGDQTTQIPFGDDGSALQAALEALDSVGAGNVSVVQSGPCQWDVTFKGTVAHTDIAAMTVVTGGLVVPLGKTGEFDLSVAGVDELVALGVTDATLQIDVTPPGGKPFTVVAVVVKLNPSLLSTPAVVPTPLPSYSTTTEMNAAIADAVSDYVPLTAVDTDGTLAANSDARVPSQKAVKTFSAASIAALNLGTGSTLTKDTDSALTANSDARVATQKAVKAYVDAASGGVGYATYSNPSSGTTITGSDTKGDELMEIEPPGTIATLTVCLEDLDAVLVGSIKRLAFDEIVTLLTIQSNTANDGLIKGAAITTAAANTVYVFQKYDSGTWRRLQ